MRILAVDPGEARIGIAISDPTGSLARPLSVIKHVNRLVDAAVIAQIAIENDAGQIIIGQSLDMEGAPTPMGRKAARLAEALRTQTTIPVALWDEGFSTQEAQEILLKQGVSRIRRRGHQDDSAAAVILQSYLDAQADLPGAG